MKKYLKYQLYDYKWVLIGFYLIMIALHVGVTAVAVTDGASTGNINAMDYSSIITFLITALCTFGETFDMWVQNNASRKGIFKGLLTGTVVIAGIVSVVDYLLTMVFRLITSGNENLVIGTGFELGFMPYMSGAGIITKAGLNLLFCFVGMGAAMMIGYFVAAVFYRAGKIGRRTIAIGLPVGIFFVLPIVFDRFYDTAVIQGVLKVLYTLSGSASGNPWYLIGSLTAMFCLFSIINYLLIIRMQVSSR